MTKASRVMKFHSNGTIIFGVVIRPTFGIHFHIWPNWEDIEMSCCGIEQHSKPVGLSPVDHEKCWLLDGPCEHDGSALYARKRYVPLFVRCNESMDFEPLWRALETEIVNRMSDEIYG